MAYKIPAPFSYLVLNRRKVTTTYSATIQDELLAITTAGTFTITLPSASSFSDGRVFVIKDETGALSGNTVTIATSGGNINGGASTTLTTNYGFVRLYVSSSNYWTW